MKNFFASSVILGLIMISIAGLLLFNINQASTILAVQTDQQTELENLKFRTENMAYNLGSLVDVKFAPDNSAEVQAVNKNESNNSTTSANVSPDNLKQIETPAKPVAESKENLTAIFSKAPVVELKNSEGLTAVGKAATAVYNGNTYHKIAAVNMPILGSDQYFKAWMIDDSATGNAIATGNMKYEASSSNATLLFIGAGDLSKYKKILVTLEFSDDSGRNQSFNVLEGRFDDTVNFKVTLDDVSKIPSTPVKSSEQADMQSLINSLQGGGDLSSLLSGANADSALGNASLEDLLMKLKR